MGELFFSQVFWETRFDLDSDCGFMAPLKHGLQRENTHEDFWRNVYRSVRGPNAPEEWKWRHKVWFRCRQLMEVIAFSSRLEECATDHSELTDVQEDDLIWKEARSPLCAIDIFSPEGYSRHPAFGTEGIRMTPDKIRTQSISIPSNLTAVTIYLFQKPSSAFITGIRFISVGEVASLGHSSSNSITIPIRKDFTGFETAMKDGRISALKVVDGGAASGWVGDARDACYTACLDLEAPVVALKAEFAWCTIRALRAAYKASDMDGFLRGRRVLLHELNCRGLFFNEDWSVCEDPELPTPPHVWALFGGRDGRLLSSLIGLRLTLAGTRKLSMIEFFYCDQAKAQKTTSAVQRVVLDLNRIPVKCNPDANRYTFDIDGPGGERIHKVEFPHYKNGERRGSPGKPTFFYKISTNRGNCICTANDKRCYRKGNKLQAIDIVPGTTPVGFYATRTYNGRASLGIISAKVPNLDRS